MRETHATSVEDGWLGDGVATVRPPLVGMRKLAFDAGLVYAGLLASIVLGLVTKVLLARALSPLDLGLLLTGLTIVGLAQTGAQLSLPDGITRFVGLYADESPGRAKRTLIDALSISLGTTVLAVLTVVIGAGLVANAIYAEPMLAKVLRWLALSIPFVVLSETLAAASRGLGHNWVKVICVDLVRPTALIIAVGALLILQSNSLASVAIAHLGATAVACALTFSAFRRDLRWAARPEGAMKGSLFRYSMPLLFTGLAAWPSAMIPLWLGSLVSPVAVSYFNLGGALSNFIYMPVNAVDFVLLQVWMRYIAQGELAHVTRLYAYTTRWCLIAGSVIFVFLFFGAARILSFLYGSSYAEGASVVRWIAFAVLANVITGTNASLLKAFGYTRHVFMATATGGAVAILGTYPSIKTWGMTGGLAVFVAAQVIGIALFSVFLFAKQRIHPFDRSYVKTLAAVAAALAIVFEVGDSGPHGFYESALLVGLYLILLFLGLLMLGVFEAQDAHIVRRAWALISSVRG